MTECDMLEPIQDKTNILSSLQISHIKTENLSTPRRMRTLYRSLKWLMIGTTKQKAAVKALQRCQVILLSTGLQSSIQEIIRRSRSFTFTLVLPFMYGKAHLDSLSRSR